MSNLKDDLGKALMGIKNEMLVERDTEIASLKAEVERMKAIVKDSYEEGHRDCFANSEVKECWMESATKMELEEIFTQSDLDERERRDALMERKLDDLLKKGRPIRFNPQSDGTIWVEYGDYETFVQTVGEALKWAEEQFK